MYDSGFQYFTIAPMCELSFGAGLIAAIKADTLSLTAWQIGMYGFMALAHFWMFGTYFFVDAFIPAAVFLGMHLLFTDPSTSPRTCRSITRISRMWARSPTSGRR